MRILELIMKFNIKLGKLCSWALLFMVIITCIVVILRYVFNIGFIWMQELVRYLYASVFMICAAYTLAEDEHVRVDIFYSKLKEDHKALINCLGSLIFLLPVCITIIFSYFPSVTFLLLGIGLSSKPQWYFQFHHRQDRNQIILYHF